MTKKTTATKLYTDALVTHSNIDAVKPLSRSVVWGMICLFLVLGMYTLFYQLDNGVDSVYAATRSLTSQNVLVPPRGLFYDRNGQRLVQNVAAYDLVMLNSKFKDPVIQPRLRELLVAENVNWDSIGQVSQNSADDTELLLITGIDPNRKILLENNLREQPVDFLLSQRREYIYGPQLAHVLGYVGVANAEDVKNGAAARDTVGKYRLEKIWDTELSGEKGIIEKRANSVNTIPEKPGENLKLTIDINWQNKLYELLAAKVEGLNAKNGAVVIQEVATGEVWAHVSYPSFDPNLFAKGIDQARFDQYINDSRQPLTDKVASNQMAPGSAFKVVTAYALLENGIIDANSRVFSTGCMQIAAGFPFCEFGKYYLGQLDIKRALTRSSNIFFCQNILELQNRLGFAGFVAKAGDLGIGQKTGANLDNEVTGVLASPEYKQATFKQGWFNGDACNSVIGQGFTAVTPLQMAQVVAAINNEGAVMRPQYVKDFSFQDGSISKQAEHEQLRKVDISAETKELIVSGMRQVVTSPEGTAYRYLNFVPGNFTAKSGSAEAVRYENGRAITGVNGWIIGTFEFEGKLFAYTAAIELGGGGWNVSQVMQGFAKCLFSNFTPNCEL